MWHLLVHKMSHELSDQSFKLRRRPIQARSIATFKQILDTAADLLETHGYAAFNTNLLADAAGLSVRAVYQYFPNKQAVIAELARRMSTGWYDTMESVDSLKQLELPWRKLWSDYIYAFVAAVRATRGARAVLVAIRDVPQLRAIDDVANRRYIQGISEALRARRPALPEIQANAAAVVLVRSMITVLDESFLQSEAEAHETVNALVSMHLLFMESLLEPR